MAEVACEVKKSDWFGTGFTSWCGVRYEESRPEGWFTKVCSACTAAKAKASKKGGFWS
jgi:hypothetical protein